MLGETTTTNLLSALHMLHLLSAPLHQPLAMSIRLVHMFLSPVVSRHHHLLRLPLMLLLDLIRSLNRSLNPMHLQLLVVKKHMRSYPKESFSLNSGANSMDYDETAEEALGMTNKLNPKITDKSILNILRQQFLLFLQSRQFHRFRQLHRFLQHHQLFLNLN